MAYRIVARDRRYAALTDGWRLKTVVDRNQLALRYTSSGLEHVLAGAHPSRAPI
jgi:hypothetical protein